MLIRNFFIWVGICAGLVPACCAHADNGDLFDSAANRKAVKQQFAQRREQYRDDPDIMVRPGLLADRKEQVIRIQGEATGMNAYDPLEFILISEKSGHDYEAFAFSYARPLAIHNALKFIGLEPGRPVNYQQRQMWPKGERVDVFVAWDTGTPVRIRAEQLVRNTRTGKTLPEDGFCFTGSVWVDDESGTGRLYAADAYDPRCIISDYNEPLTVLDVPRKVVDSEVYGYRKLNVDYVLPPACPLEFIFQPRYKDGLSRTVDLTLSAAPRKNTPGHTLGQMTFTLTDNTGESLLRGDHLRNLLAAFGRMTGRGMDPFVVVVPNADLPLAGVHTLYRFLSELDTGRGIRIEPPARGHLYYKAFLPNEQFRRREDRPSQPLELRLYSNDTSVTGMLYTIEQHWNDEDLTATLDITPIAIPSQDALAQYLADLEEEVPVMLVFAPEDMAYGALLSYIRPMIDTSATLYVFLPEEPPPEDPVPMK
jgi:hypothetical protein